MDQSKLESDFSDKTDKFLTKQVQNVLFLCEILETEQTEIPSIIYYLFSLCSTRKSYEIKSIFVYYTRVCTSSWCIFEAGGSFNTVVSNATLHVLNTFPQH